MVCSYLYYCLNKKTKTKQKKKQQQTNKQTNKIPSCELPFIVSLPVQ